MENNDPKTKIGNMIQLKILKHELIILALIIFVVCLSVFNIPYSGIFLNLVLVSAACIYFFSAFAVPDGIEFTAIDNFLQNLVSYGSAVALMGILFKIQKWPNSDTMIYVGLLTLGICLIALVYQRIKNPEIEKFNKLIFIRMIIFIFISGALLYFEKNK